MAYIFYCLRLLYSIPAKRFYFKKVFPPKIFGKFVDITEIPSSFHLFQALASDMRAISGDEHGQIVASFKNLKIEISMDVKSSKIIKKVADYSLLDLLGAGAYGKVYLALKVGKFFAIKVIPITSEVEYDKNCKEIEILSIVSSQNFILYFSNFV